MTPYYFSYRLTTQSEKKREKEKAKNITVIDNVPAFTFCLRHIFLKQYIEYLQYNKYYT